MLPPYHVTKSLEIVNTPKLITDKLPNEIKFVFDSEFTQKDKMVVNIIAAYIPLLAETGLAYTSDRFDSSFHPILTPLNDLGFNVKEVPVEILENVTTELSELYEKLVDGVGEKKVKKLFHTALNDGYFDEFLTDYGLTKDTLYLKKENDEYVPYIKPRVISIIEEYFFQHADIFKITGKDHQHNILQAKLSQYRVIKTGVPITIYTLVNDELCEFQIEFSETFHRIPPLSDRSLDGNAKALGISQQKIDIKTDDIAQQIGVKSGKDVITNFTPLLATLPELAITYCMQDVFLTHEVSITQQILWSKLCADLGISDLKIADTTGSNVAKLIIELIYKHFNITKDDKESSKLIKELLTLTKIKNLQEIPLNDFGIQPFLTVGGLLFTRTALHSVITGNLSDCDESSCYATQMSEMCIYIGEPVVRTFKYEKYKPKLRDVIEFVKSENLPRDGWFIRVSGTLKEAVNTLVMSDLRFEPKSILCPTVKDLRASRKSIEQYNAFKTPKKQATSTLLTKQIKFGLINADTLDCLMLLPAHWVDEYLDLSVDALIYHPPELIADSPDEVLKLRETLPDEAYLENFDPKSGIKNIQTQYCKANVALRFDIGKYWDELRKKRAVYKKAKNPVQEVFKLVGNSGYGVLACLHLATNNLVASNMITAGARAATWIMTNALNGFAPITDGTCFNWDTVPVGKKFRDILTDNPNYLFQYDSSIVSGLNPAETNQNWISEKFKQHLHNFYEIDETHIPANRFGFELKEEVYTDNNGKEIRTTAFTSYYNTNAGNYSKGMVDCTVLIDGTDYDFSQQNNFVKARSFKGKESALISWYISSLADGYHSPIIYAEDKLVKFADGSDMAIRLLSSGRFSEIVHPCGFSTSAYKAMKLVSRSQFLFQNEKQLKNFETNEEKLANLSKEIFTKKFWQTLTNDDLAEYGALMAEGYDYYTFSRNHPVGVGFELLALSSARKHSIQAVRSDIQSHILNGCTNFNAALNLSYHYKFAENFKYLLAAIIVLKANAEEKLIATLVNSLDQPTLLTVKTENIRTLEELRNLADED